MLYAEVDLEMKAKALERCDTPDKVSVKRWRKDHNLISFLKTL